MASFSKLFAISQLPYSACSRKLHLSAHFPPLSSFQDLPFICPRHHSASFPSLPPPFLDPPIITLSCKLNLPQGAFCDHFHSSNLCSLSSLSTFRLPGLPFSSGITFLFRDCLSVPAVPFLLSFLIRHRPLTHLGKTSLSGTVKAGTLNSSCFFRLSGASRVKDSL